MNPDDPRLKNLRTISPEDRNKGGPLPADVREARDLTRNQFIEAGSRLGRMNLEQLKALAKHPESPAWDVIIAMIMLNAARYGDPRRADFILNRIIGRAPVMIQDQSGNEVPLSVTHRAVIELIRDLSGEDKDDDSVA